MTSHPDVWIGANYRESSQRVLILGESVYWNEVKPTTLQNYLSTWIARRQTDYTFSRIFNALSGTKAADASPQQRQIFWDALAFYNFVTISVGNSRASRPTKDAYLASRDFLRRVVLEHRPCGVLVLGKEQARFSAPVLQEIGTLYEVARHPAARGVPTTELSNAGRRLLRRIEATSAGANI